MGCGPGNFRKLLGEDVAYYGIDPMPLAETDTFSAVRAIAEYLPLRANMFIDIVVMAALDHFQDVGAFCEEAVRVLQRMADFMSYRAFTKFAAPSQQ